MTGRQVAGPGPRVAEEGKERRATERAHAPAPLCAPAPLSSPSRVPQPPAPGRGGGWLGGSVRRAFGTDALGRLA